MPRLIPTPLAGYRRISQRTFPMGTYRTVAQLALFFLLFIMVTGATVRLTGSGLGCPDWPSCDGARPVPELEFHGMIEFFNRLVSFPTLLFTVASFWMAARLPRPRRDLRVAAGLTLLGVLTQVVLGGATVRMGLSPLIVSAHFLLSIVILVPATFTAYASRRGAPVRFGGRRTRTAALPAVVMLASCAFVIVAGVMTTAAGPHSGAELGAVERLGDAAFAVKVHARAAWLFFALVVGLTLWRRRSFTGAGQLTLLTGLVAVQVILGEVQYRTGLPWGIVLAHVATASLIWVVACWTAIDSTAGDAEASGEERGLSHARPPMGQRSAVGGTSHGADASADTTVPAGVGEELPRA